MTRIALCVVLLMAAAACMRKETTPEAAPRPYKPAVSDYGTVNNAWVYTAGKKLKAEPATATGATCST
jgi:hypothetical protein